ncbi:MAG: hypothetical protein P4M09_18500 [Devosia sp.]|nr:hypothetical protein [Devosia sp.]
MMNNRTVSPLPESGQMQVRATTGQSIALRYDPATNAIVFVEDDWFAGSFRSSAVPPKSQYRKRISDAAIVDLRPLQRRSRA